MSTFSYSHSTYFRNILFWLTLVTLLSACQSEDCEPCGEAEGQLKSGAEAVDILNDQGSKIWVLKSDIQNGVETIPEKRSERLFLTLYADGTFRTGRLSAIDEFDVAKGNYRLSEDGTRFFIALEGEQEYSESVIYEASKRRFIHGSEDGNYKMIFVPYDKPEPEVKIQQKF